MKKVLAFLLVLTCVITLLASCNTGGNGGENNNNGDNSEKRVPVYQGMTIGSVNETVSVATLAQVWSGTNNGNGNNGDNGNHYGQYKGDHNGKNEAVDEENPYPDNDENENIENEIKSSLDVVGSVHDIYYTSPNEDIYIYIHIDNPDNFEIMSFTLNGKKYSNYMFEKGSDMETIILKYNVGTDSGIVEYTIDAIKYIDGTEIKDVIIDGDKTVRAGIKNENQVTANVSDIDINTNSISFDANVKDDDGLIAFSNGAFKAVVYDGTNIVAEKDIALGYNKIIFDGLKTNTIYQFAIVGYYDDLSGNGFGMNVLYKDAFYTESVVLFDNITIWHDEIDFTFLWHEDHQGKNFTTLKLYKDGALVKELDASSTSVGGLLSANTYNLVAEYQNGDYTESIYLEFTTFEKGVPVFNFSINDVTKSSVSFDIVEVDSENVGSISKIELVHANGTVVAENIDVRKFANLLSNSDYTIKVTYTYNLNDGNGEQVVTKELAVTTLAKAEPVVEIKNESVDTTSIKADYIIIDVDGTLVDYRIDLYNGNTLVAGDVETIDFTSLNYYTDYIVKITYTYNLNNGNGVQTKTNEKVIKTLPYIDVIDCNIANTSAVSEGETIFMQVTLDNPLNMTVESVVVNGETYSVTGSSTSKKIFVEIVYNDQFDGGDTYLKIDKVNAKIDNTILSVEPKTELSDNVFINGKLEVLKIEFVNENFDPIDWAFPSAKVYVLVYLNNPTGYSLQNVVVGDTTYALNKLDNNIWYFTVSTSSGWNTKSLTSISYFNEYVEKTSVCVDIYASLYKVASNDIKYISNANDLKSMNSKYYYELTNDIDLAGQEWLGYDFSGVFNGNGYSINNMAFVGTINNADANIGLFSTGAGVISNITINNSTIVFEVTSDDDSNYYPYCGGLIGKASGALILNNCTINEDSMIAVTNQNHAREYVGGLVGYTNYALTIVDSTNCGYISGYFAGGLLGYSNAKNYNYGRLTTIIRSTNEGKITGNNCGGLAGYCLSKIVITDSSNSGHISSIDEVGGLVGSSGGETIIKNCANYGILEGTTVGALLGYYNSSASSGIIENCINYISNDNSKKIGFIGDSYYHSATSITTVINSYSLNCNIGICGTPCTVNQLNSKSFYTETLGWSEGIWDFSDLDIENGKYPKLK